MKIDPNRLRTLREEKGLTRLKLAERSGLSERTIRRLESEPDRSQKSQEHTLNSLAKALGVEKEPGVLTGDVPLPESDNAPADTLGRVQIGAKITPKARLAYDLIKRRYGVNATEIINMAPLFFVLLAEGCLAQQRETLKKADEAIDLLSENNESGHGIFYFPVEYVYNVYTLIEASIEKADLFGEHLFGDSHFDLLDSTTGNPFANYLRKLAEELNKAGVVKVDNGTLDLGGVSRSKYKFPYYDICGDELNHIANGSPDAKRTLETGCARLSEIPKELMAEDAEEERAKWLEDKLLDIYKKVDEMMGDMLATAAADDPKVKETFEELYPKKGDDQ